MITIATLPEASAQEVFDQVAKHLLKQNERSIFIEDPEYPDSVSCVYRTDSKLMCAAGCLIGDDEYDSNFEGLAWSRLVEDGLVPKKHARLITSLQYIHDNKLVEDWPSLLRQTAKTFKLSSAAVEGI